MVIWLWLVAVAAAVQIQLRAEPAELRPGQAGTVRLLVVASTRGGPQADTRRPPPLPTGSGLVSQYVGQARQFQNVNGRITQILEIDYRINAVEPGTWSVGPVELTLDDGSRVRADAVQVKVAQGQATAEADEFSVEAGFDRESPYEGEVVVFHTKFQSRIPGAQVRWRLPEFDGLRPPNHGSPDDQVYTIGDPRGVITVQQVFVPLVAVATGSRDQSAAIGEVALPMGGADLFGFRKSRVEQVASKRLKLDIRPLPPPPPDFSGLVGDFEIRSTVQLKKAAVGQSVPWTLLVVGNGSLDGFGLPPYEAPGASIYENDADVSARIEGERYRATAAFNRVIVPTTVGELALPGLHLVTFSPSRGEYVTHDIEMPKITVVPGREGDGAVEVYGASGTSDAAEPVAIDVRPVYTWGRATAPSLRGLIGPAVGLAAAPGLLFLAGMGLRELASRRRLRSEATRGPPRAVDALRGLPSDPAERLVALDTALRRLEVEGAGREGLHEAMQSLRARLGRVRFGEGMPDPTLEDDIRKLVAEVKP